MLVHGYPINYSQPYVAANLYPPGWAGLGWSPEYPPTGPPQMINASAVMGWLDSAGQQQVPPAMCCGPADQSHGALYRRLGDSPTGCA